MTTTFTSALLAGALALGALVAQAQSVGIGTTSPAPSAALDVTAPANNQGFLPPRLTEAQRDAIANPAPGLLIYNTESKHLNQWDGTSWTAPLTNTETAYTPGVQTFGFTGAPQTYTVPRGVTSIVIDAVGASGTAGTTAPFPPASRGARVLATLAVTPGEVLQVYVGGAATVTAVDWYANGTPPPQMGGGGYNGGGNARYTVYYSAPVPPPGNFWYRAEYRGGGGGATDIRRGGTALSNRIVVAAGGGGACNNGGGGDGGGLTGLPGGGNGGQGGTQSSGGAPGTPASSAGATAGSLGQGGVGNTSGASSGGGGGGYYGGGGGGGGNSGGGGGSSYAASALSAVTMTAGYNAGNGSVTISPAPAVQYAAPAISGANVALPSSPDGGVVFSGTPGLKTSSQLFWDDAQTRLGIGTNAPAQGLHLTSRLQVDGGVIQRGGAAIVTTSDLGLYSRVSGSPVRFVTNGGNFQFFADDNTGTTSLVTFLAGGNVGIGTPTPGFRLHVTGGVYSTSEFTFADRADNSKRFSWYATNDRATLWHSQGGDAFTVGSNGNVGVGTTTPLAKLHVNGSSSMTPDNQYTSYFSPRGPFAQNASVGTNARGVAAYISGGQFWVNEIIIAGQLNVSSDARIKHVVGRSNAAADLALLNRLRITDYTYIDQRANTDQVVKKVIAQEVQAVLPAAVSTSTQAVPNVFAPAVSVQCAAGRVTVRTARPHGLPASGGRMRLYTATDEELNETVAVLDAYTFSFASATPYEQLFVYGKFVTDFLSVDYDALAMLNVSATQELARQLAALQAQLHQQTARADKAEAALSRFEQRLQRLETGSPAQALR